MSEPAVDTDDVRHMADLAHVHLDDEEIDTFAEQFAEILEWFETLDTVPQSEGDLEVRNVLRPDEVRHGLDQKEAIANASKTEDGYFKGPPVG